MNWSKNMLMDIINMHRLGKFPVYFTVQKKANNQNYSM